MIYDTLAHLSAYHGIHPRVMRGLELLRDRDFSKEPDGKLEIEGDKLFCLLQSYETRPFNNKSEAHRHYADIMMMLSGREKIGVAPLERLTDTGERPGGDIRFYRGETFPVLLEGDRFVVLFPGDGHAPGMAVDGKPEAVRKCVVKVCLD